MEAKVQILKLFTTLNLSDKLNVVEELTSIIDVEQNSLPNTEVVNEISEIECNSDENINSYDSGVKLSYSDSVEEKPVECIECGDSQIISWGKYRGLQRYKCKNCGHTFTSLSKTVSHGVKKIDKFIDFGELMFDGEYHSLSYLSEKFKISISTAFDWRHKYLGTIGCSEENTKFSGEVEMDDIWIRFNEKGRKGKEEPKKRGGTTTRGDNDNQVKILFSVERGGDTDFTVVRSGRLQKKDIARTVENCFEKSAILISDRHPSIVAFGKDLEIEHKTFKADKHVGDKGIHVQTINSMASRFKTIINDKMHGVATKYLQNYADWFRIEERYKSIKNKFSNITKQYLDNQIAWDYFSNIEKIYKRFIEGYTKFEYENPVHRTWKSCNWNFSKIEATLH